MLRLTLPWPPSVNRYYRSVVVGRSARVLLSAEARSYHRNCACFCAVIRGRKTPLRGALRLTLALRPPDRRRRDIDGPLKCLLDALTRLGVWADDSQVKKLEVEMLEPVSAGSVDVTVEEIA